MSQKTLTSIFFGHPVFVLKNLIPKICPSIARLIIFKDFRFLKISELTPFPCLLPFQSVDSPVQRTVGQVIVDSSLKWIKFGLIVWQWWTILFSPFYTHIYIQKFTWNHQKSDWMVNFLPDDSNVNNILSNCIIYFYSISGSQMIMPKWWF